MGGEDVRNRLRKGKVGEGEPSGGSMGRGNMLGTNRGRAPGRGRPGMGIV
jgi:hypothetical protein